MTDRQSITVTTEDLDDDLLADIAGWITRLTTDDSWPPDQVHDAQAFLAHLGIALILENQRRVIDQLEADL